MSAHDSSVALIGTHKPAINRPAQTCQGFKRVSNAPNTGSNSERAGAEMLPNTALSIEVAQSTPMDAGNIHPATNREPLSELDTMLTLAATL